MTERDYQPMTPDDDLHPREFKTLIEVQKLVCAGFVHIVRIADLAERRNGTRAGSEDWEDIERGIRLGAIDRIEEEALLVTAARLRRWLERAHTAKLLPEHVGARLLALPDVKQVRDMREHLDDYMHGKGQQRKHFVERVVGPRGTYVVPADWTLTLEGERYIGGRIKLNDLAASLADLHSGIVNAGRWTLSWTPHQLVEELRRDNAPGDQPQKA